jgi:hypothetical protein
MKVSLFLSLIPVLLAVFSFFVERLRAGEMNYQLITGCYYNLPGILPNLHLPFFNPAIEVYQRKSAGS